VLTTVKKKQQRRRETKAHTHKPLCGRENRTQKARSLAPHDRSVSRWHILCCVAVQLGGPGWGQAAVEITKLLAFLLALLLLPRSGGGFPVQQFSLTLTILTGWAPESTVFSGPVCELLWIYLVFFVYNICNFTFLLAKAPLKGYRTIRNNLERHLCPWITGFTLDIQKIISFLSAHSLLLLTATWSQVQGVHRVPRRWITLCSFLAIGTLLLLGAPWGEGFTISMDGERVTLELYPLVTKEHREEPKAVFGPKSYARSTVKRSYRRAVKRSITNGFTWYRGRLFTTPKRFPSNWMPSFPSEPTQSKQPPPKRHQRRRLLCLSWNSGGLAQASWDMFQQWAENQHVDFITMQETHWPFTSEWTQSQYHCIHSGFSSRQAGILCMVSQRLCQAHQISWTEIEPGRLIQIRIHGASRNMDFLAIYQHVHSGDRLIKRQLLLDRLNDVLSKIPQRNLLVLLGDFNTSLLHRSKVVGSGHFMHNGQRCTGTTHSDSQELHDLLRQHSLLALNTWMTNNPATFAHGQVASRIDYVCCRQVHADHTAKQVQVMDDFFMRSATGAQHAPLLVSLLRHWTPPSRQVFANSWTYRQRLELYNRWDRPDSFMQGLQQDIQNSVAQLPIADGSLEALHSVMNQIKATDFTTGRDAPVHQYDLTPFQAFQHHERRLRALPLDGCDLTTLFQAWFHISKRLQARRLMNTTAKQSRRAKMQKIFDQADAAERSQDHFRLYQAVRALAPKQKLQRIQLRHADGTLANPSQAANMLQQWYEDLYHAPASDYDLVPFNWPFSADDLLKGFLQLPMMKSLAPSYAPAPIWRMGAWAVVEFLQPLLHRWSADGRLPRAWSDAYLTFLPKPGGNGGDPAQLRPISLLEPSGKVILGLAAKCLLKESWWLLQMVPQFAYLPRRGCSDAIGRLMTHLRQVRHRLSQLQYPVHRAASGDPMPALYGGLIISLDLSKAFDQVNRALLFQGLSDMQISPDLIALLQHIYHTTGFDFIHKGEFRHVATFKGIRQGCKCAPILWTLYFIQIFNALHEHCPWDWLQRCITAFADDICQHDEFSSPEDFLVLLRRVGHLLDCLAQAGLPVNLNKTVALCRMTGKRLQSIQKRFFQKTGQGMFLKIPRIDGTVTLIKLVHQHAYLGVKLSYFNFEAYTMAHRLQAGKRTQQLLHKWLHLKSGLKPHQRVKLWQQCVLSSCLHGLIHTGFQVQHLLQFHRTCILQLRRIFKEPVHLTLEPNVDFLNSHGILPPLVRLRDLCDSTERREQLRVTQLQHDDILHLQPPVNYAVLRQELELAQQRLHSADLWDRPSDTLHPHQCQFCDAWFSTIAALRRHWKQQHDVRPGQIQQVTPSDSLQGLPTCTYCHTQFTTWANFRKHIQFACCGMPQADQAADLEHRLNVVEFLHYSNGAHFQALAEQHDLLRYMRSHCILCGKHVMSARGMFHHWSTDHADTYRRHGKALETVLQGVNQISPCNLCGCQFTRSHRCVIHSQIAMHLASTMPTALPNHSEDALHVCDICQKAYVTKHGLRQHIQRYHRTMDVTDSDDYIDMQQAHNILVEAVETDDCATLLLNPMVLEYLGTWCPVCKTTFAQRNILSRHLRHHHATLWNDAERFAMELAALYCQKGECYCPSPQRSKHICTVFLQFSMLMHQALRYAGISGPAPGLAGDDLPTAPAAPPSIAQTVAALVFNGQVDQLYLQPDIRLRLTIQCCFCPAHFRSGDSLTVHCRQEHADLWTRSLQAFEYLKWVLFGVSGCCCNPGAHHGDEHECISLRQIAMVYEDLGMPIFIPYSFKAKDVIDLLINLVSPSHLQELTVHLMMRRFGNLWQHRGLLQMLRVTCLICQTNVSLNSMQSHLKVEHNLTLPRFAFHMHQLADIFYMLHSTDPACDYCGAYLHTDVNSDDLDLMVREHLKECPMMMQIAVLLSQPMWEREFTSEVNWPTQEVLLETHRKRANRRWQFQAPLSEPADCSLMMLANCAKHYLDDEWMVQYMTYGCLVCGRQFFSRSLFLSHLMDVHNYHQYLTEKLHHLLLMLQTAKTCPYCGSTSHASAVGKRCIAIFNLATALCNGWTIRRDGRAEHGSGILNLEECPQSCSTQAAWPWRRKQRKQGSSSDRAHGQKAQGGQSQADAGSTQGPQSGVASPHGEIDPEAGGHVELPPDGTSIPGPRQHWQWEHNPGSHPSHTGMEIGSKLLQGSTETPARADNDDGAAGQGSQTEPVSDPRRCGQGMLAPPHSGPEHGDAIPEVESSGPMSGTDGRQMPASPGGAETPGRNDSTDGRQCHHSEVPLDAAHGRHADKGNTVVMDGVITDQSGTVASNQISDFSLMLAACAMQGEVPQHATFSTSSAIEQTGMKPRLVRLLLNPSRTLCYANAALQCLAWVSILCSKVIEAAWKHNYGLIDALTKWTPVPLTLYDFAPFQDLFNGGDWGLREKDRQNDLNDFTSHILMLMAPQFVNNFWLPQPALLPGLEGTGLQDEKGHVLQPITLPLHNTLTPCSLSDLIQSWHDPSGLCRTFVEAPIACCFAIDRNLPPHNIKNMQPVDLRDGLLKLPFLNTDLQICWKTYRIIAIAFHIGKHSASGHWRAALYHQCKWFVYDDGRLPEQMDQLPSEIHQQVSQIWMVDNCLDRTPLAAHAATPSASS